MPRKQQFAALEAAGITAEDQRQVGKARRIIDAVNARLASRGSALTFFVGTAATESLRPQWASPDEFSET